MLPLTFLKVTLKPKDTLLEYLNRPAPFFPRVLEGVGRPEAEESALLLKSGGERGEEKGRCRDFPSGG